MAFCLQEGIGYNVSRSILAPSTSVFSFVCCLLACALQTMGLAGGFTEQLRHLTVAGAVHKCPACALQTDTHLVAA